MKMHIEKVQFEKFNQFKFLFWLLGVFLTFNGTLLAEIKEDLNKTQDNFIDVASITSQTGFGAHSGLTELNGTILAIEEINSRGGVLNKPLRLYSEDNHSETKLTVSIFQKLHSINKISYLIGPNWTEFSTVLAPIANRSKVIMITPTGHSPDLMERRPYVFSMQFPVAEAIKPLSKYLLSRNVDKITIFISPNAYYEMLGNSLEAQISDKLNVKKQIVPADSLDYRTELTKIRQETNTAIVVFLLENGPASTFVKQAKNIGIDPGRLILGPIVRYDEVLKKDHALTEGIIHLDYSVPIPKDFQEMYLTRFKSEPAFGSVLAYDAVYLLKYGIEMCGDDGSKLVDCLAKVNFKGKSGPVKFDQDRNRIITNKVTNGTFIQLP